MQYSKASYSEKDLKEWYPVVCTTCGWKGLSRDAYGGESIGDTGDYGDLMCPVCHDFYEKMCSNCMEKYKCAICDDDFPCMVVGNNFHLEDDKDFITIRE